MNKYVHTCTYLPRLFSESECHLESGIRLCADNFCGTDGHICSIQQTKYPSKQSILYFCTTEKYKYLKMISRGIFYSMKFIISVFTYTWDFARVLDIFSTPTFFMHLSRRIHLIIENFRLSWLMFLSWFTV